MASYIQQLRQPQVFGGWDPNQEMMDAYAPPPPEIYDPNQDMGVTGYQPQPIQQPQVQQPQGVDPAETYRRIMDAYTPETSARDRQNQLLDNYPGQYTPTTGDRWAAGLLGLGERNKANGDVLKVQNEILQGPRMRDIEDWKNQITPAGVASTNENARNMQERQLLTAAIQADTQAAKLAETARNNDMKNEAAMVRARAYDFSQRLGKGWDWDLTGPTAKKFNKTTGETIDTGLPTGKMDEQLKIELQNEGKINAAREAGAAAMGRTVAAGAEYVNTPTGPQRVNPRDPSIPPPPAGSTPMTGGGARQNELDTQRDRQISDYISIVPGASRFFMQDPITKNYTLADPPPPPNTGIRTNILGKTKELWDDYYKQMEQYNKAKKTFFPNVPPSPIVGYDTPAPNGAPANRSANNPVIDPPRGQVTSDMPAIPPVGTIRMRAPDGRIVNVPANQVAEAEKRGGRRLQ